MADILVTLPKVDRDAVAHLTMLAALGLTGVRIVVKGRPAGEIVADVERLLALTGDGVLTGPVWVDFPGVRPRVAAVAPGSATVEPGALVTVSARGAGGQIQLEHGDLVLPGARPGAELLFADGLIRLRILDVGAAGTVRCEVLTGGTIRTARSVSVNDHAPVGRFGVSDLDVAVAGRIGDHPRVRYVVSWVESAAHVTAAARHVRLDRLIPKIESPIPAGELDRVMAASPGPVLVGRADLVACVGRAAMPDVVDTYVTTATRHGKEVYVGSLLLDSLEVGEHADGDDLADVSRLRDLGVAGFLLSGGGDPVARARKVSAISSMINTKEHST